jgi:alpha-1,2-mannosyltransferase
VKFWLTGYFLHSGNFPAISLGSLRNQSLLALILRVPGVTPPGTALWLAAAVALGGLGLASAALLARSGQPTAGWITCGVTGVLLSPISWDNHWVWVIPMLALLTATAVQQTRRATRLACWAAAAALAAVFADWPDRIAGPAAFIPHGLLGFGFGPHPLTEIYHLHGFQLISWNVYALAGLAMFALLVAWAAATRKPPAGRAGAARPPHLQRSSTPPPGAAARTG